MIMINDVYFNGSDKHILLSVKGAYSVEAIYSAWKEWASQATNAGWQKAFDTTGGDAVGGGQEVAPYFFCRNDLGWLIKMPEQNGEIVISGNLFPRDPTQDMFQQTTGYDAFLRLEVSTRAVVITVPTGNGGGGGGGLTVEQDEKLNDLISFTNSALPKIRAILVDTDELQENQSDWAVPANVSTFNSNTDTVVTDETSRVESRALQNAT